MTISSPSTADLYYFTGVVKLLRAILLVLILTLGLFPAAAGAQPDLAEVVRVLSREDLYLEPTMAGRMSQADRQRLAAKAAELRGRGWTVKFALISRPPAGFQSLGEFTSELHRYLNLRDGLLIVASQNAVSAKTDRLGRGETQGLTDASRRVFTSEGYAAGMAYLADSIVAEAEAREAAGRTATGLLLGLGFLALVGLGAFLAVRLGSGRRARLKELQGWHAELTAAALEFDRVLGPAPTSARGRDGRRSLDLVLDHLVEVGSKLDRLGRAGLFGPKPRAMAEVARELQEARDRLAALADSLADEFPELKEVGLPDMLRPEAQPEAQFPLACFFCARPLRPDEAREVVLELGTERRRVVVDPEHYEALRRGEQPPVRTVEAGGRQVPWFEDPNFDPRRDYRPSYSGIGLPELLLLWGLFGHPVTVVATQPERTPQAESEPRDTWFESPLFGPPDVANEEAAESPLDFGAGPGDWAVESDFGDMGDVDVDAGFDGPHA